MRNRYLVLLLLTASALAAAKKPKPAGPPPSPLDEYIREQERRYIEETIKHNGGSREKAAKMLGISMATLYRKLEVKGSKSAD